MNKKSKRLKELEKYNKALSYYYKLEEDSFDLMIDIAKKVAQENKRKERLKKIESIIKSDSE